MKIPPFLKEGDTIALTASARSITREQIAPAVEFMQSKGFKLLIDEDLFRVHHQFGGTDKQRAQFTNKMIANPEVKALWNVRGGYGSGRMIDELDVNLLSNHPKWMIGFSDYTVIHHHVMRHCDLAVLHATMPIFMFDKQGKDLEDVEMAMNSLVSALKGDFQSLNCQNSELINAKDFKGEITGGNLSVLMSIQGTNSETDWTNKILFIEDLDEYYYHIDRMMQTLRRGGKLKDLKAVLVGSFIQMHDHTVPFGMNVKEIITEHCASYGYPIVFDVNAGHHLQNMTIPLGVLTEFKNGIITFASS
ncbi:MAG TPA: LD-carboxypeptidase [Bacteroidia bacterium]